MGEQLAAWGKAAMLQTIGRKSGKLVLTAVGFIEEDDGCMLVAAGSDEADWALNLRANPHAIATVGEKTAVYNQAIELEGDERSATLVALILKYGTPSETLGRGPVFRLMRPLESAQGGQ
ncbi:MAG TPA: nitroreductase family deazaflavin-dependent oxidoreductase [Candidatus Limnocylindria bacterium]|nr:nitroreductase family deazaflavin-dependent oxidoreductase [Candidatus Limnocylindria bacterium]